MEKSDHRYLHFWFTCSPSYAHVISREFKLGIENEIAELAKKVDEWKAKHVEAIKQLFEK